MTQHSDLILTPLDGPTLVIDYTGSRFVVDPTFDSAQEYPIGSRFLTKTTDATWSPDELGDVDAVLLSHDQHPDNLDHSGRELLRTVPVTLTNPLAAERLGEPAIGLAPWEAFEIGTVTVTAVPAQHGPDGTEHLTGPVTGFVLTAPRKPTLYVSGDNASLDVVRFVAERFPNIDVAVLFAGAATTPLIDGFLTLTSQEAVEAARILGGPMVMAAHTDGWAHFSQDGTTFRAAFADTELATRLLPSTPGQPVRV